ncbi:MAG: DUF448 domain-containing protein [Alphaproteobacteria bacterium]|nr:DUF448 domain-containing protein [Alphaproteobacteria bacterium]
MTKKNPKTNFQKTKALAGERRCLVSGEPRPREALIRFVLGPDDMVYPDLMEKLDGRGVWISAEKSVLQTAVSKRLFNKGFGKSVKIPENLVQIVQDGLTKHVLDLLSLANKSGAIETGFDKIKDASAKEKFAFMIEANDGSLAERNRLAQRLWENIPIYSLLSREQLSEHIGRDCVHLAVKTNKMTATLQKEMMRLDAFLNEGQQNE